MFNWNDQEQVGVMLWDNHKKNEDQPMNEGSIWFTFGECSKRQRDEDARNPSRSMVKISGAKHDFLTCNVERRSGNSCLDCNDSSPQMDSWSDLPCLSSVLNDGNDEDTVVNELMNDLTDASNLYSGAGIMTRYNNSSELFPDKGLSSFSKPFYLSAGDAMHLDGETGLFGDDDKGNDSFLNYDWANIEDLDALDNIFKNNDSFDINEEVHSANSFHNTSVDIARTTSQSIAVPGVQTSVEQTYGIDSSFDQLGEHSDANVDALPTKADGQTQTWRSREEVEGKGVSFLDLDYPYSSERQPMSGSEMQGSNVNPSHIIQSPPLGQVSFAHGVMFSDHDYLTPLPQGCVESNQHKPINGGYKANLNRLNDHKTSNKAEAAVPKEIIMTPREKIKKHKRRKKMQTILAIQKQREHYGHQIFSTDESVSQDCLSKSRSQDATTSTDTIEEYKQKHSTPEVRYLDEQCRSQEMPSSINGPSLEVAIYDQLQYAMQKLDLRVRLNIRDSLFRLARSAMERLNSTERSCTDKNKDEYEISMDEESKTHGRSSIMPDSERVTNPIDRIVAHLLFHNFSSGSYSLPIGDGNVAMATSM